MIHNTKQEYKTSGFHMLYYHIIGFRKESVAMGDACSLTAIAAQMKLNTQEKMNYLYKPSIQPHLSQLSQILSMLSTKEN